MRNHYVPEFYFKPWLDGNGHLFQFSRQRDRIVADKKTPGQICYIHDLHTFTGIVRAETRHYVEQWLTSAVDSQAARVIQKILVFGFQSLDAAEGSALIRFIQAVIIRRPESVRTLREQTAPLLLDNMSKLEQETWPDVAATLREAGLSVREWVDKEHPGLIENAGQLMIGQLIANSSAGPKLFRLEWIGVDVSGTAVFPLLASDKGVTALGKGLDDSKAIMILPLAPHYVVFGAASEQMNHLRSLGKGRLGLLAIQNTLNDARRYVYGSALSNADLINRYLRR